MVNKSSDCDTFWSMTHHELNQLFENTGLTPPDFQRWAREKFGVTVHRATISRHRAGTQGITAPWEIAYKLFLTSPETGANQKK